MSRTVILAFVLASLVSSPAGAKPAEPRYDPAWHGGIDAVAAAGTTTSCRNALATEGLGIIAPVLRDRPKLAQLAFLGLIGGAPAILGTWMGGFTRSPTLAVLFLAIGTGAIFEVVYEVAKLIQKDTSRQPMPLTVFSGILVGMLLLWVTGLWIK